MGAAAALHQATHDILHVVKGGKNKDALPADEREGIKLQASQGSININLSREMGRWASDGSVMWNKVQHYMLQHNIRRSSDLSASLQPTDHISCGAHAS